ncbi:hypothetical protein FA95DRAFT_1312153 [Auriscalpium vulgare]|uniref:Uncharacterized protein n=1 Tax=Auriscalpium vulgare TaxID=40419 RepID=A0ACB8RTK1_9AGAM|nr:hypothetical protein FA95DRAFT_1312153 [Auriscalpium vulgare]
MSSLNGRKRARATSTEPEDVKPSLPVFERHASLWYDDGNVIVIAEDLGFRIHRGVLSRESTGLAAALAEPPGEPDIDDCRVLRMSDSAKDVDTVLEALYGLKGGFSQSRQVPVATVSAYVRLGVKYDIPRIREEGASLIRACYPNSFQAFAVLVDDDLDLRAIAWSVEQECEIALLILQHEELLRDALPLALYGCAIQLPSVLTEKMAGLSHVPASSLWDLLARIHVGRHELLQSRRDFTFSFLSQKPATSLNCAKPVACSAVLTDMARNHFRQFPEEYDNIADALEDADNTIQEHSAKACKSCVQYWRDTHQAGRRKVWDTLADHFDLGEDKPDEGAPGEPAGP